MKGMSNAAHIRESGALQHVLLPAIKKLSAHSACWPCPADFTLHVGR